MTTTRDHLDTLIRNSYLTYYNFYNDDPELIFTRADLDAEIALDEYTLRPIDDDDFDYANAFLAQFTIDTCSISIIATLTYDADHTATQLDRALISTDTMPYTDMLNPA